MEFWFVDGQTNDFGMFVTTLSLRVAELRAEINDSLASFPRTPEYFAKVGVLSRRAQALEQEYQEAIVNVPEDWWPKTVAWVDQVPGGDITKAEVCPGKVDMYRDIWVAWTWNNVRIARLYISGAILRCAAWICFPMDYRTTPEYATASKLCADLVADIIAAVPYHLGWRVGQSGALRSGDFEGFSFSDGNFSNPKALGGFFIMYPLLGIMCTDYITDSQRAWAKGRLLFISDVVGLNHAKVLSSVCLLPLPQSVPSLTRNPQFQLRLPSMIIRRDILVHSPSIAAAMMAAAARGQVPPSPPQAPAPTPPPSGTFPVATFVKHNIITIAPSSSPQSSYTMSPIEQRDTMQRDQRERERKSLLSKASNSQGEAVEKLLAVYLAV